MSMNMSKPDIVLTFLIREWEVFARIHWSGPHRPTDTQVGFQTYQIVTDLVPTLSFIQTSTELSIQDTIIYKPAEVPTIHLKRQRKI